MNIYHCQVSRQQVSDDEVSWSTPVSSYSPPQFTASFVLTAAWADPPLEAEGFNPAWNTLGREYYCLININ